MNEHTPIRVAGWRRWLDFPAPRPVEPYQGNVAMHMVMDEWPGNSGSVNVPRHSWHDLTRAIDAELNLHYQMWQIEENRAEQATSRSLLGNLLLLLLYTGIFAYGYGTDPWYRVLHGVCGLVGLAAVLSATRRRRLIIYQRHIDGARVQSALSAAVHETAAAECACPPEAQAQRVH